MTLTTVAAFAEALSQHGLLEPAQLQELARELQARFPEPRALARELLQRGWLTAYQVNTVLQGRGAELLLGPYVLLERLGEGGMGQVFKARHRSMGRIAAVKVVRKDRLGDADSVRRFQREIRAAAHLSHPNVVAAHGADEMDGNYFLAMEYVAGMDMSRLVKRDGPLPVALACEYIRQTALGLQHAFEKGMVHRDIKPHNLLVTADGALVKILDLGLARVLYVGDNAEHSATLTQEGALMGTPDYMAPEQTLDSRSVDIRADLYSLGCTLYFLLTGRAPFLGGTLGEKIVAHLTKQAVPVEQLRPEVAPAVSAIVRRLLAKKPEERYQTPAELATALAAVLAAPVSFSLPAQATSVTVAERPTAPAAADPTVALVAPPESRGRGRLLVAGGAGLLGLVVLLVVLLSRGDSPPSPAPGPPPGSQPPAQALLFNGKDLSGWEGLEWYWSVKDGAIVGSSSGALTYNTCLCTRKKYRDFELQLQVRLTDNKGNSGVQIRSEVVNREKYIVKGPQCDMGEGFWGDLYGEQSGGILKAADKSAVAKALRPADFNDYFIRCVGKHVTIRLNGVTTVDEDFPNLPDEGIIGLQIHSGVPMEVTFRNFRFTDLSAPPPISGPVGPLRVVPEPVPPGGDGSPDFAVQGEYEGTLGGKERVGAQVVALGGGTFRARLLRGGLPGSGGSGELAAEFGARAGRDGADFDAHGWRGTIRAGRLTASADQGRLELQRVSRRSPTLGTKAPPGAVVLFDGLGNQEWTGAAAAPPGLLGAGATSKRLFRDFRLHLEFRLPFAPEKRAQARANSGVFLQNRYEIQVLDSFGLPVSAVDCGALYNQTAPRMNMCLPPGAWQTYDLEFRAARYGPGGRKTADAEVTLRHNGVTVLDWVAIRGPSGGGQPEADTSGPIHLQQHGNAVVYRNIWVVEPK